MACRRTSLLWSFTTLILALTLSAAAQDTGLVLSGTVADSTGAVVQNAEVVLGRPGNPGFSMSTRTDAAGRFRFDALAAGEYVVTARVSGFNTYQQSLTLSPGAPPLALTLSPATARESLTVNATHIIGPPEMARTIAGSIDVLDQHTLEIARVFNFGEALRKISGVNVREEEGFGLRPNIGIRGLSPTRATKVLLLEDGLPLAYAPYGDNASYYHPPIERFRSIEVLKGAGQVLYGPATVGGVINYITPEPPQRPGGTLTLLGGNRGYFNGNLAAGGTWRGTGVLLDLMRKQGDGARENIYSRLHDVNLKIASNLSARHALTLRGNYYGENSNVTYSGLRQDEWEADRRQNPFRNDFFLGDRWGVSGVHTFAASPATLVSTSVYGSEFQRHWWRQSSNSGQRPNDASDPACGGMDNLNTTCGNEGRLRSYITWGIAPQVRAHHSAFGIRNETAFGVRAHFENQKRHQENGDSPRARSGVRVEDNERVNQAYSGFVQNRFTMGKWSVTPGVRLEHIRYERINHLTGVRGRTDLTEVVPGLGVAYSPIESTTLFAGVHRGFAPPRTEDIINNTTGGSVDLDPELSWNYEVGARTTPVRGLRFDATYFRMDYENQIVPASLAGGVGSTLTNGGETLHQGLEFTARVDAAPLLGWRQNVYVSVAQASVFTAEFRGERFSSVSGFRDVSITGNRLPYAPENMLTVNFGYSHPRGIETVLEAVRVSDQFADDLNTIAPTPDGQRGLIPAATTWNATVNYHMEQWRSSLFVTVKNLADNTFIVDRSRGILPNSPRMVQGGLRFRF